MLPLASWTRIVGRSVALAALTALCACALMRGPSLPEDATDIVTLNIINHHRLNVTVFNVAQGRRERLGEVTAASTASFKLHLRRLPAPEIQLFADPIGAPAGVTSEVLHVSAGDNVDWTLETDLGRSHAAIR
ncbi:MAG TPA: hypothetical protein VK636_12980 [Gemmatimonadaceae bacterium]|nr:hypothetical protein [Gemmatimonadaceae bacterium]